LILGRYALHGEIASGGMATVCFGRLVGAAGFSRAVAIKRLHPHLVKDPEFSAMFLDEARLAARVRHPGVVSTLDVVARREFLDEILALVRQDGPTVFISSHILSDIERVADHIGILVDGTLKISEPLDELSETVKQIRFHSFTRPVGKIMLPGAFRTVRSESEVLVTARIKDESVIAQAARDAGAQYEIIDLTLEDIFVEISRH